MPSTPSLPSDYELTSPESSLVLSGFSFFPTPSERQRSVPHGLKPPPWHSPRLENIGVTSVSGSASGNSPWNHPSLYQDLMCIDPAPIGRSVWSHPSIYRAPFSMPPTPSLPLEYETTFPESSLSPLTLLDGSPIGGPHTPLGSRSSPFPSEQRRPAPPRDHQRLEISVSENYPVQYLS
ncbi:hypothetical protein K435DRAFT_779846 [Dendrothele bispora CBS 962.96]|uniref:Uncharacterized protein n=1 Tax=Dendrothele bispora (strain CBS 962.96) TaxID=1314807 RepID=A0A4S8LV52_DENBC|nr:hypothetical protein K435DRAFT_779846 [Dendrothele bispora CBS 962.96]